MSAGNSGKSVKSCEELVKREPENKWFWRELAISYDERSYTRKAYMAYEKAYELGCRDNGFLLDFSTSCDNYEQYDRGIQVLTELARKDRRWKREEIKDVLQKGSGFQRHAAGMQPVYPSVFHLYTGSSENCAGILHGHKYESGAVRVLP